MDAQRSAGQTEKARFSFPQFAMSTYHAQPSGAVSVAETSSDWTFLTNHSHVLFCLAQDPDIRLRDVADRVGITERAVQRIVTELEDGGYITRQRQGRRNTYQVHDKLPLRHNIEKHRSVADLLRLILSLTAASKAAAQTPTE